MTAMRYRLRTLLIVLALGPMVLAVSWWSFGTGRLGYIDAVTAAIAFLWLGYITARLVEFARRPPQRHHPTKTDQQQSRETVPPAGST